MALHKRDIEKIERIAIAPTFARQGTISATPKVEILPDGMMPRIAYQLIHDELMLDGNARQNLATFVTTFMDPEADQLFAESSDKNMIDKDEYPQTAAIEGRCVSIISNLWNAPVHDIATGTSTSGDPDCAEIVNSGEGTRIVGA